MLRPGGGIRFTEPNMANPQIAVQKNVSVIKRWAGDSPDETAFFRWSLTLRLLSSGFVDVEVEPDRGVWHEACSQISDLCAMPWALLSGGDRFEAFRDQLVVALGNLVERRDVPFGNHQDVGGSLWADVLEGEHLLVLEDLLGRNGAVPDLAEETIGAHESSLE